MSKQINHNRYTAINRSANGRGSCSYKKCAYHVNSSDYLAHIQQHNKIVKALAKDLAMIDMDSTIIIKIVFHFLAPVGTFKKDRVEARASDIVESLNNDFNNYSGNSNTMNNLRYKNIVNQVFNGNISKQNIYLGKDYMTYLPTEPSNIIFELGQVYFYPIRDRLNLSQLDDVNDVDAKHYQIKNYITRNKANAIFYDNFLNIWIVDMIGTDIMGFANFAWETRNPYHGIVINLKCFFHEDYNDNSYFCHHKTITHQVGHFLGLLHTSENNEQHLRRTGNINFDLENHGQDYLDQDNIVVDPSNVSHRRLHQDGRYNPLFMNFMEHTCDKYVTMFTPSQIRKMRFMIKKFRPEINYATNYIMLAKPPYNPDTDTFTEVVNTNPYPNRNPALIASYESSSKFLPRDTPNNMVGPVAPDAPVPPSLVGKTNHNYYPTQGSPGPTNQNLPDPNSFPKEQPRQTPQTIGSRNPIQSDHVKTLMQPMQPMQSMPITALVDTTHATDGPRPYIANTPKKTNWSQIAPNLFGASANHNDNNENVNVIENIMRHLPNDFTEYQNGSSQQTLNPEEIVKKSEEYNSENGYAKRYPYDPYRQREYNNNLEAFKKYYEDENKKLQEQAEQERLKQAQYQTNHVPMYSYMPIDPRMVTPYPMTTMPTMPAMPTMPTMPTAMPTTMTVLPYTMPMDPRLMALQQPIPLDPRIQPKQNGTTKPKTSNSASSSNAKGTSNNNNNQNRPKRVDPQFQGNSQNHVHNHVHHNQKTNANKTSNIPTNVTPMTVPVMPMPMPNMTTPTMTMPPMSMPSGVMPNMPMPNMTVTPMSMPNMSMPNMVMPSMSPTTVPTMPTLSTEPPTMSTASSQQSGASTSNAKNTSTFISPSELLDKIQQANERIQELKMSIENANANLNPPPSKVQGTQKYNKYGQPLNTNTSHTTDNVKTPNKRFVRSRPATMH